MLVEDGTNRFITGIDETVLKGFAPHDVMADTDLFGDLIKC